MIKFEKIKKIFKNALMSGCTVNKLAQSFSMGIFIAFFPIPGSHTVVMIIFKWLFGLNFPVLFFSTSFNNPWTMVPFFTLDYFFGYWLMHEFLRIDPGWAISLGKIFGNSKICLWSFFIGGNILGLFFAIVTYPFVYFMFKKLVSRINLGQVKNI